MKRFQQLLVAERDGAPPWADVTLADDRVAALAARLGNDDVTDILDWMDHIAAEKAALPQWDGDTHSDIGMAQHQLARLLAALPASLASTLDNALASRPDETRQWVRIARDAAG
jgi:hypothetical protein